MILKFYICATLQKYHFFVITMLRTLISLCILVTSVALRAEISFGNSSTTYNWQGDEAQFSVLDVGELQLTAETDASPVVIYTSDIDVSTTSIWLSAVTLDFAPSTSNYMQIVVAADAEMQNYFAINIAKNISLVQVVEGSQTTLVSDTIALASSSNTVGLSLEREISDDNRFLFALTILYSDAATTSSISTVIRPRFFDELTFTAIKCVFTKTRASSMYIYDFSTVDGFAYEPSDELIFGSEDELFAWSGDVVQFASTGTYLTLDADNDASPAVIYTSGAELSDVGSWSVVAEMDFAPTSSNYMQFIIAADDELQNFIAVNIAKNVALVQCTSGTTSTLAADTCTLSSATNSVGLRLQRTVNEGLYLLSLAIDYADGTSNTISATVKPQAMNALSNMAVRCVFSKSHCSDMHLHDFSLARQFVGLTDSEVAFRRGDVVINEIMPIESDIFGLPAAEFIELYNTSERAINLADWTISNTTTTGTLPDVTLRAGEYLVLVPKTKIDLFVDVDCTTASPTSWPTLTNSACTLILRSDEGRVSDVVNYTSDIFGDTFKSSGGYAIERIDATNLSCDEGNWAVSESTIGATPGHVNSVAASNPDLDEPLCVSITMPQSDALKFVFNEPVDTSFVGGTITVDGVAIAAEMTSADDVMLSWMTFQLSETLSETAVHEVRLPSVNDLAGNALDVSQTVRAAVAQTAEVGDILINEILFTAQPSSADFVEIYNASDKSIDMKDIYLGVIADDVLTSRVAVSSSSRLIFPSDYVVLSADSLSVDELFGPLDASLLVTTSKFPTLNNDEKTIAITLADGTILEKTYYNASMHNALLDTIINVSLERKRTATDAMESSNWTSATELSGFATPTKKNSPCRDAVVASTSEIELKNRIFTPDGDGLDDELIISTCFESGTWHVTMRIYTPTHRLIAMPYNNVELPTTCELTWNGLCDDGSVARPGTYVVHMQLWSDEVQTKSYKRTCVVAVTPK